MRADRYLADFDSATAMLGALACALHGRTFERIGLPRALMAVAPLANALPVWARERIYATAGGVEATPARRLGRLRAEAISRWVVEQYPRRRYPAMMIGSASGGATHLAAALGIPWLPQTFLLPVQQRGIHPDEPRRALMAGLEPGRLLLEANPELSLHHMVDPVQDRLMAEKMTYFRVKRLRLGEAYMRFIEEQLDPGGTLFVIEVQQAWPVTRVADRHVFQFGAVGGATPEEFHEGGPRVEAFLRRHGSSLRRWDPPRPDGEGPEAEWGFEPALLADVERLAARRGYRLVRVILGAAEDMSPLTADLHRAWYRSRGLPARRLLVESFALLDPTRALTTGSVPFWTLFCVEPSALALERYLSEAEPYDEIYATLFAHGVDSIGYAPPARWRGLLERARERSGLLGVDERRHPRDLAVYGRFQRALDQIPARYPLPGPLSLGQLDEFVQRAGDRYAVRWIQVPLAPQGRAAA